MVVRIHYGALVEEYAMSSTASVSGGQSLLITVTAWLTSASLIVMEVCLSDAHISIT